jgi:hypothetical protein
MKLLAFCFALSSGLCMAETLSTQIHSVEKVPGTQSSLIKFTNGRVAILENSDSALVSAKSAVGKGVIAEVNGKNDLVSLSVQKDFLLEDPEPTPAPVVREPKPVYEPTVLNGYAEVEAMFNRLNLRFKPVSECSDRAHTWSYDEFTKNGIKSKKIFVFFTASYINRNGFKWWFHVAPMVSVNENGTVQDRVLDYQYTDRPSLIKEWTDKFVFSKRECKYTDRYSEHDHNPQTEDCYYMVDSMYYHFPGELQNIEELGKYRTQFSEYEVKGARQRAFRTGDL